MRISLNICFWSFNDTTNRIRNTIFSWERLKRFTDWYNSSHCSNRLDCFLFDLSNTQVLSESIHLPFIESTYERSKKINHCIEWNILNYKPDIICFLDSDIFFLEDQYINFSNAIENFDKTTFAVSDVWDIKDNSLLDFDNYKFKNLSFNSKLNILTGAPVEKRTIKGLGAFFMIDLNAIVEVGGFDERFIVWGGEDDDLRYRLQRNKLKPVNLPVTLFHINHETLINHADVQNFDIKRKQLECWLDPTIVRKSTLSKYRES